MRRVTEAVAILFLVVVGDMPPLLALDYVTAVITCPLTANQKLEWQPTIGSNPTFRNIGPVSRPQQAFHLMERSGQTIKCFYKNGGDSPGAC